MIWYVLFKANIIIEYLFQNTQTLNQIIRTYQFSIKQWLKLIWQFRADLFHLLRGCSSTILDALRHGSSFFFGPIDRSPYTSPWVTGRRCISFLLLSWLSKIDSCVRRVHAVCLAAAIFNDVKRLGLRLLAPCTMDLNWWLKHFTLWFWRSQLATSSSSVFSCRTTMRASSWAIIASINVWFR